eukprot:COSAG01_NODE_2320_length_7913_cov_10.332864_1_plen_85_part_00
MSIVATLSLASIRRHAERFSVVTLHKTTLRTLPIDRIKWPRIAYGSDLRAIAAAGSTIRTQPSGFESPCSTQRPIDQQAAKLTP